MKKVRGFLLLCILLLFLPFSSFAEEDSVVWVPIKGEINRAMAKYTEDSIHYAEKVGAAGIVFEIDTPGGLVISAEEMKNAIITTDIPTVCYVNTKAESAGVLIAISGEKTVMNKNSTIGSAEPIPNTEKNLSFWRSLLRDTAQYRKKNVSVIEGMADSSKVIEGVSPKGKLINLTAKESLDLGVADKIEDSKEALLKDFFPHAKVEEYSPGPSVVLATLISKNWVTTLLIVLGMAGAVVELFTPGFGVAGAVSVLAFGLFFIGNMLAGYADFLALGLFVLGLLLIVLEGVVPGFGLPGISGIICVILGLILAMESWEAALSTMAIAMVITAILTVFLIKKGLRSPFIEKVTLQEISSKERGYISNKVPDVLPGDMGIAVTDLRPAGFISIDGTRYDALSEGGYIDKSQTVQVIRLEGAKIFVRRI